MQVGEMPTSFAKTLFLCLGFFHRLSFLHNASLLEDDPYPAGGGGPPTRSESSRSGPVVVGVKYTRRRIQDLGRDTEFVPDERDLVERIALVRTTHD